MVSVMRVDVATKRHFIVVIGISVLVLVIAIIVGSVGPEEYDSSVYSAYQCQNSNHTWDPQTCSGTQLSNGTLWSQTVRPINALNRFWILAFAVYTLQDGEVYRDLSVEVVVFGRDSNEPSEKWIELHASNTTQDVVCGEGPGACIPLVLVDERDLLYTFYRTDVRILNGYQTPSDSAPFVGDVEFTIWTGHTGFTTLELALRIVFLFLASVALVAFLLFMRGVALHDWAWEQKALVIIQVSLIALNNPFYGMQYAVWKWLFHFLDAVFTVTFLSVFLLFGLLVFDKLRLEEVRMEIKHKRHLLKYLLVGIFAILGIVLFAWVDIRDELNPILGHPRLISAVSVLFYIVATVYAGILVWLAVLVVMTVPVATAKPYLMTRFLFISIPTSFCILSILVGIFCGTFGPLNESTLSMVYFLILYNLYVWVLTFGYWPVQERFVVRNPSEVDSFTNHFDKFAKYETL